MYTVWMLVNVFWAPSSMQPNDKDIAQIYRINPMEPLNSVVHINTEAIHPLDIQLRNLAEYVMYV